MTKRKGRRALGKSLAESLRWWAAEERVNRFAASLFPQLTEKREPKKVEGTKKAYDMN